MIDSNAPRVALVGLGKMGISHLAIANASRFMRVTAICDSTAIVGQMVEKYCNIPYVAKYEELLKRADIDAVVIATPTRFHEAMVGEAIGSGKHVFCEKPMTLSADVSRSLAERAASAGLVGQVGYHNRFVGTFAEAKRLIDADVIGPVRHVHAEAYGPVVLRPAVKTWRSDPGQGGGCLYDYAAHPINLMTWYLGVPLGCSGAELQQQYSQGVEDAVYANLVFANGVSGQISVNWSDETMRKMTTRITVFGDGGKIIADRQELQVFIGTTGSPIEQYERGWTVRNITELTENTDYYLRGEEYSAQMDSFGSAIESGTGASVNDFASAADTDLALELIRAEAAAAASRAPAAAVRVPPPARTRGLLARVVGR